MNQNNFIHPYTDPAYTELDPELKLPYMLLISLLPRTGMKIINVELTSYYFDMKEWELDYALIRMAISGLIVRIMLGDNKRFVWAYRIPHVGMSRDIQASVKRFKGELGHEHHAVIDEAYRRCKDIVQSKKVKYMSIPASNFIDKIESRMPNPWMMDMAAEFGIKWDPANTDENSAMAVLQQYGRGPCRKAFDRALSDGKHELSYVQLVLEGLV